MSLAVADATPEPPLVVDVDGTLLRTDLLQEAVLQFVAHHPFEMWRLAGWLMAGKAALKSGLADRVDPGIATAPLREEPMRLMRAAKAEGRTVCLASASDSRYVQALAERIGGIDFVFGTEPGANLAGQAKAEQLAAKFGERGFDYIGDSPIDFAVWRRARKALVVAHSNGFAASVLRQFPEASIIARPREKLGSHVRAARPHQWAKNALLFLPLIAGHRFDLASIASTLLAFLCFSCAASSAYVINDLLDLPGDRVHPRKSGRPFASGDLSIARGGVMSAVLMVVALGLSLLLPLQFSGVLVAYVVCTLSYSLYLKRKLLIDVIILGGLYTLRVIGGLAATGASETQWLLMFSLLFFLSLAIVKRCTELTNRRHEGNSQLAGRGYRVEDLKVLFPLGAAAGFGAVFVVMLYLASPEVMALYRNPARLWLICPLLLYWIGRVFIIANRGDLDDDPVIFALTNRTSLLTGACVAAVIAAAI